MPQMGRDQKKIMTYIIGVIAIFKTCFFLFLTKYQYERVQHHATNFMKKDIIFRTIAFHFHYQLETIC